MTTIRVPAKAQTLINASNISEHLTVRQLVILHLVAANPECGLKEIAEAMAVQKPAVTRASYRLHDLGLLTICENPTDRRLVSYTLTRQGLMALDF